VLKLNTIFILVVAYFLGATLYMPRPEEFGDTQSAWLSWRRGSVVRASVFDWLTFPDMRLIYG